MKNNGSSAEVHIQIIEREKIENGESVSGDHIFVGIEQLSEVFSGKSIDKYGPGNRRRGKDCAVQQVDDVPAAPKMGEKKAATPRVINLSDFDNPKVHKKSYGDGL